MSRVQGIVTCVPCVCECPVCVCEEICSSEVKMALMGSFLLAGPCHMPSPAAALHNIHTLTISQLQLHTQHSQLCTDTAGQRAHLAQCQWLSALTHIHCDRWVDIQIISNRGMQHSTTTAL